MLYNFGEFALDARRCELLRAGEAQHLEAQVYAVLCFLIENRDRLVSKEELLDHVWGHRFVAPATLSSRIKVLRRALGDDGEAQHVIQTVRGRGYRFVPEVTTDAAEHPHGSVPGGGSPTAPDPAAPPAHASGPADSRASAAPFEQQIRFCCTNDGIQIAFATSGSGSPIVKTSNWLTNLDFDARSPVWRPWLRELARDHMLVRYDGRGCGLSDRKVGDLSLDTWVRDLEAVVDSLRLERFTLLGLSQGGSTAIAYAVRHPERVASLVLYGAYMEGRWTRAQTPEARAEAEVLQRMLALGWGRDNPAFRDFFARLFLPEGTPEQIAWFTDLQQQSTTVETAIRLQAEFYAVDVVELATHVSAPTLVLHASADAVVPFDAGRRVSMVIPGARFVPLYGTNHILLEVEPAWRHFWREVRAFLGEVEGEASPVWLT